MNYSTNGKGLGEGGQGTKNSKQLGGHLKKIQHQRLDYN
jgi:hypothetical protein